jgi:endonuclease/exonuclease/phosphatase family metal-dependent hydrolase
VLPPGVPEAMMPDHSQGGRGLSAGGDDRVRVMTFNLRFAHPTPPNLWPDRRPVVGAVIERCAPDLIGTQEGLFCQLVDMADDLPAYRWIGLGRNGGSHGEFMAVFYRRDRFDEVEFDHFWLSDTPRVIGSRTWGNEVPRMVTWVRFRDRRTGCEFYVANTHLDHKVAFSRERSAALIVERMASLDPTLPLVLMGDFNSSAGDGRVHALLTGPGGFVDSWREAGRSEPPIGSYHAFGGVEKATGRRRIDWVLTRGGIATLAADMIVYEEDGQYPSDHFPVTATLRVSTNGSRGGG